MEVALLLQVSLHLSIPRSQMTHIMIVVSPQRCVQDGTDARDGTDGSRKSRMPHNKLNWTFSDDEIPSSLSGMKTKEFMVMGLSNSLSATPGPFVTQYIFNMAPCVSLSVPAD